MALGFVLFGIATGLLLAGVVFASGAGLGLALIAYMGGGLVGMLGALASYLVPAKVTIKLATNDSH